MIEETAPPTNEPVPVPARPQEVRAHYVWTVEELLTAGRLHGLQVLRRPFRYGVGAVFVLMFMGGCVAIYGAGPSIPSIFLVLVPIYVAFFRRYEQRWTTKRQFRKRPDKEARLAWTFTSDGMRLVSSEGSKCEMPWSSFSKAVIAKEGVLLYPMPQLFYWLPRSAFESDAMFEEFISMVQKGIHKIS